MSDDNDLIRRGDVVPALRAAWSGNQTFNDAVDDIPASPALQEARDKIAALEAENERLIKALEWVSANECAHPSNRREVVCKGLGIDQ